MPFKDREAKLAYQREWYARNKEKVVGWVSDRKHKQYAGVCLNCGGPTVGQGPTQIPEYCGKPACASAQRKGRIFGTRTTKANRPQVVDIDQLTKERDAARRDRDRTV